MAHTSKAYLLKFFPFNIVVSSVQLHGGDGLRMEKDKIMLFDDSTVTASLAQLREVRRLFCLIVLAIAIRVVASH